jgi:hypothetical protein
MGGESAACTVSISGYSKKPNGSQPSHDCNGNASLKGLVLLIAWIVDWESDAEDDLQET